MNDLRTFESPVATPDGLDRRSFVKAVTMAAAAVGLNATAAAKMVEAAVAGIKPSVIWLHFQECTGCTESLLRTSHPDLATLILDLVSLDYHETLMAAAGHQAEEALHAAMKANDGKYICVIEGAIPTKDDGIYCMIGGKTALSIVERGRREGRRHRRDRLVRLVGRHPLRRPQPDRRDRRAHGPQGQDRGHPARLPGEPLHLPRHRAAVRRRSARCPRSTTRAGRQFAYGRTIHEHCPRRAHFDAGRFVQQFGDEGHRQGYCLYKTGCKGPATHASCSTLHFGEVTDAWPIGLGHPCFGCTEQSLAFRVPLHDTVMIERPTPPDTYPGIHEAQGHVGAIATGVAGLAVGAALGAGYRFAKKLGDEPSAPPRTATRG